MNKHNLKIWADQQDWSQGYTAVARANNMNISTVWVRARKLGIKVQKAKRGRISKMPPEIDFSLTTSQLVRQHGVSRQYIQLLRRRAGWPESNGIGFRHPLQDALDEGCRVTIDPVPALHSEAICYRVLIADKDHDWSSHHTNLFQAIQNAATEYREFKELFASPESDEPDPEFPYSLP